MVAEPDNLDELVAKIEAGRRKLDAAIKDGLGDEECYLLSRELDDLIALYIDKVAGQDAAREN